jgi:transposase
MGRFHSGKHFASWAGVCPGNQQSGGKRLSGATTNGNVWLRGILGQVAWAAVHTKGTSFRARFRRIARRQGKQKALVAVMHNLLLVI